jgi:hypothetical protein
VAGTVPDVTWQPGPRPEWVRLVNEGGIVPIARAAAVPFEPDVVLGEALARLGRAGADPAGGVLGDPDFLEPLGVFCTAVEAEAELTVLGRWTTHRYLRRLLTVRRQLVEAVEADPGLVDEEVVEPIVVVGAPRTGTTVVHALLDADPAHRAPEGWELLWPVPSPEPDSAETDPRVGLAAEELALPQTVSSGLLAIHAYSGRMRKECLSAMAFSLRSEELISRTRVPSYVAWLQTADMTPAYRMHRLVLQVLQRRQPGRRWVLKSPVHLQSLPTLLATYPDARLVVTHRDPTAVLGSVTSLVATMRSAFSDRVDATEIGRYHLDLYGRSLDRLVDHVDAGLLPPGCTAHVHHAQVTDDGLGALTSVYDQLGLVLGASTRAAVIERLEAMPRDEHGSHRWDFADLGLDRAATAARFARYRAAFGVDDG